MYMILWWQSKENDDYLTTIKNKNGSIMLFDTLKEADDYADANTVNSRVISIEAVKS